MTPLRSSHRRYERAETGQSLVEFTLMMVFLVVLLMGVLDLARAYFTYLALKDAAAEGAYFGSAYPQCVDADGLDVDGDGFEDDGAGCAGDHNVLHRVTHSAVQGGLVDWTSADISTTVPVLETGEVLTVTVSYQYELITPFVGTIANGQVLTLTATSAATIIRVPNCTNVAGCQ